jgi:hypothetical protein
LARSDGNVTGAFLDQAELSGKWLELMREGVAGFARVTAMHDGQRRRISRARFE